MRDQTNHGHAFRPEKVSAQVARFLGRTRQPKKNPGAQKFLLPNITSL
jgi:hypothetical protein